MIKKIVVCLLFLLGIVFSGTTSISARETIDFVTSFYPGEGEIGSIEIYDDYVIRIAYKYSASDVEIKIDKISPVIKMFLVLSGCLEISVAIAVGSPN